MSLTTSIIIFILACIAVVAGIALLFVATTNDKIKDRLVLLGIVISFILIIGGGCIAEYMWKLGFIKLVFGL